MTTLVQSSLVSSTMSQAPVSTNNNNNYINQRPLQVSLPPLTRQEAPSSSPPPPPLPARPVMACNLCGNIGPVVACEDCSSMTFCSACDDMYHRHPKRKFHLRKSVAHPPTTWNPMNGNKPPPIPGPRGPMSLGPFPAVDAAGHPSKMPIPPPRRKKSLRSLSSLDGDMFGSNGSVNSLSQANTGTLPGRLPSAQQTQVMFPSNYPRNGSVGNTMIGPINGIRQQPQPLAYSSSNSNLVTSVNEAYIDPVILGNGTNNGIRGSRSSSSLNRKKNNSLQDLRNVYDPMMSSMMYHRGAPPPPPPPPFMHPAYGPYNPYGNPYHGYPPMNPWDYQSVDMDDEEETSEEDEGDEEEEEVSVATSNISRNSKSQQLKNRSMRHRGNHRGPDQMVRSYSSYQLPVWQSGPPPPPPPPNPYFGYGSNYGGHFGGPNPYYPPHPSFYGTSSFASSSPPSGSLQSLTNLTGLRRKKSLDALSTSSSRKGDTYHGHRHHSHKSSSNHRSHRSSSKDKRRETSIEVSFPRTLQDHRSNRRGRSGSKTRSVRSTSGRSSRYESESDEEEDDYAEEDDEENDAITESEDKSEEDEEADERRGRSRSRRSDTHGRKGEVRGAAGAKEMKPEDKRRKIGDRIKGSLEKLLSSSATASNNLLKVPNDGSSTKRNGSKTWSCKHCTYVNRIDKEICDICYKSKEVKKAKDTDKKSSSAPSSKLFVSKTQLTKIADELNVSDELVEEQIEIERELRRRKENEERIRKENEMIEEQERKLKEKMNENLPLIAIEGTTETTTSDDVINEPSNSTNDRVDTKNEEQSEEESDDEVSESLAEADHDKKRYQRRSSPKKSFRTSASRKSRHYNDDDTKSVKSNKSSKSCSKAKSSKSDEEEDDEVEKEMKAIETLISSLAQQKLDIEKIERFISTATVSNVNPNKKPASESSDQQQPQQMVASASMPMAPQLPMTMYQKQPGQMVQQSMIPIQNFQPTSQQPTFYPDHLFHRPSFEAVMSNFNTACVVEPPLPPRMASLRSGNQQPYVRYDGSYDDVSAVGGAVGTSGLGMIKLLREAERKGFSADDVEVAMNFSPSYPIKWLNDNWMSMIETVLRFTNNQIIKNGQKRGNIGKLNLINERDAKVSLRKTKGDIRLAVEKCLQMKELEEKNDSKNETSEEKKSKDFTLKLNEEGAGSDNHEINCSPNGEFNDLEDVNLDELNFEDIQCGSIIDPNVSIFHPDDSDSEGDEELINLFIEKWKYEKEMEANERNEKELNEANECFDKKLFDESYDEEDDSKEINENDELKKKKEKMREKFFSSLEEIDSIVTNGPETGKDLRKYLFNKYFGNDTSDDDTSLKVSEPKKQLSNSVGIVNEPIASTSKEEKKEENKSKIELQVNDSKDDHLEPCSSTVVHSDSDEYEYVEVTDDEEDLKIPDTKESRKKFFGGKNLDEYVSLQDNSSLIEAHSISEDVNTAEAIKTKQREIDTSNLGNTFEFLMSLNVDELDADETIEELMKINGNNGSSEVQENEVKVIKLRPRQINSMSRSESPRFKAEPDTEDNVIRIVSKEPSRESSPLLLPSTSRSMTKLNPVNSSSSLTNLLISNGNEKMFECLLCANEHVIVSNMVTMLYCEHQACKECMKKYLTLQIKERNNVVIQCPFCKEPEIGSKDEEAIWNFVSLFDVLIRSILDTDVYELYQRKCRDRTLMKDPNFRWCPSCSSGFIASNVSTATTVMCPDCQTVTCVKCNSIWEPQHEDMSCEAFYEWKRMNDPSFLMEQLDTHLKLFGINCPNCHFHYELSKGGCMHFHCIQCEYDFCGGCNAQFVLGSECAGSKYCEKLGLHAHHPRNCLFYLRDKEPDVLMKLLDSNGVIYNKSPSNVPKFKPCPVMEQKRSSLGYKDMNCGRLVEFSGFCRNHYIEYLGQLIMKHKIDPIDILEEHEMEMVLKRNNFQLPEKVDYNYKQHLVETIKQKCPLIKNESCG